MLLMQFFYSISHVPGKNLHTADTLLRAPLMRSLEPEELKLQEEVVRFVNSVTEGLPASDSRLSQIRQKQNEDTVCIQIKHYCTHGWPESQIQSDIKPYWSERASITIQHGLLMKGKRIIVPASLRSEILQQLHSGHQGIVKCRARAKESVWWPGLSKAIQEVVNSCELCAKDSHAPLEPLIPSQLPQRPWQKVASDLFELKGTSYLLVIDYFSRYVEMANLGRSTESVDIVKHLKSIFARHGIPEGVMSYNGPQYTASNFAQFADAYGFQHITSSPKFPQSNGEIERAVQTVKRMIKKAEDPYLALLAYRSAPLEHGHSPAELLFGRSLRTTIPTTPENLKPRWPNLKVFRATDKHLKDRQKANFDTRHRVRKQTQLEAGDSVWITDKKEQGTIVEQASPPRSYVIETPQGHLRRNRHHLVKSPDQQEHKKKCQLQLMIHAQETQEKRDTPLLSLNIKKTNFTLFHPPQKKLNDSIVLCLNGKTLGQIKSTKYLGVLMDCHLNWKDHVHNICKKLTRSIGIISKLRHFINIKTLVQLYYTLIYPFLTYSCMVWGNTYTSNLKPLEVLQKRTIRIITFSRFDAHTSPLFAQLKILKMPHVIVFQTACFMFRFSKGKLPKAFNTFFSTINSSHDYNTRLATRYTFSVPSIRSNYGKFNIRYAGPKVWNNIDESLKPLGLRSFKTLLKLNLLHLY